MTANISQTAFEHEAMPHLNDLYRTAARLVRNKAEAEDLIQEVFLQAWKSWNDYEAGTNCRAWLYKILFFKISHYRRRFYADAKRIQNQDEDESRLNNAVYAAPVATHLTDEDVIAAVDRLPANHRAVVLLADVEEFAYKEIAEILTIPIGTVMSRLSRARKTLRESLSGTAGEFGIKKLAAVSRKQAPLACAAC